MKCRICDYEDVKTIYDGPIRSGGAESSFEEGFTVKKCAACGVEFLDPFPGDLKSFYETERYWTTRQGEIDVANLQKKLDEEQLRWLDEIGMDRLRGSRVADFGCGAGLFLDLIKGVASETIGIDLASYFSQHLEANGHHYIQYVNDVEREWLDIAVSFDTLEHQEDPQIFLQSVYNSLKPGGIFFMGVPNQNDFLKRIVPAYMSFFYHKSHLFYFSAEALTDLLRKTGFRVCSVSFVHKYDLMNLIGWTRDGKGCCKKGSGLFDRATEDAFRSNLERQGIASHIFVETCKEVDPRGVYDLRSD